MLEEARAEAKRRNEQSRQRREAANAEKAAGEQRKAEQLAHWVRDRMDDNAQGRFQLGLLAEDEILASMRERVFAGLNAFPRYQRIKREDIPHLDACFEYPEHASSMSCENAVAESISGEQYVRLEALKQAAPDAALFKVRTHSCKCDNCEAGFVRFSVLVTVPFGELTFSREYSLEAEAE